MLGNQKHLTLLDVQSFPENGEQADPGLGALKTLIGLSLLDNVSYHSHYCYQTMTDAQEINVLFPYFYRLRRMSSPFPGILAGPSVIMIRPCTAFIRKAL